MRGSLPPNPICLHEVVIYQRTNLPLPTSAHCKSYTKANVKPKCSSPFSPNYVFSFVFEMPRVQIPLWNTLFWLGFFEVFFSPARQLLVLHMWGSLGSITLALLQQWDSTPLLRFLRYATILGGLSFIVVQQWNQQHCYASDNRHRDVTMVFGILLISVCMLEFARVKTWFEIVQLQTCLCVGLWTPFGWKTKFRVTLREKHVSLYRGWWRQSIVGASAD
jgi:hypothetical protein